MAQGMASTEFILKKYRTSPKNQIDLSSQASAAPFEAEVTSVRDLRHQDRAEGFYLALRECATNQLSLEKETVVV
jgi:hypothetical protein